MEKFYIVLVKFIQQQFLRKCQISEGVFNERV